MKPNKHLKINFSHPLLPDPCIRSDPWPSLHLGWVLSTTIAFHGRQKLLGEVKSWQTPRRTPKTGWVPCACLRSPLYRDVFQQMHCNLQMLRHLWGAPQRSILEKVGFCVSGTTSKAQPQAAKKLNKPNPKYTFILHNKKGSTTLGRSCETMQSEAAVHTQVKFGLYK